MGDLRYSDLFSIGHKASHSFFSLCSQARQTLYEALPKDKRLVDPTLTVCRVVSWHVWYLGMTNFHASSNCCALCSHPAFVFRFVFALCYTPFQMDPILSIHVPFHIGSSQVPCEPPKDPPYTAQERMPPKSPRPEVPFSFLWVLPLW